MSSKSVQIIGGDQRQHAYVDGKNNALVTIDHTSSNVIRGLAYFASSYTAVVANGTDLDFAFTVITPIHMKLVAEVSGTFVGTFYSGTTYNGGTAVTAFNKNEQSVNTSDVSIAIAPTVTAVGTEIQAIGSQGSDQTEWVLGPGTYLLRLNNASGGPASVCHLMDFYQ